VASAGAGAGAEDEELVTDSAGAGAGVGARPLVAMAAVYPPVGEGFAQVYRSVEMGWLTRKST
jgi:hypothetical protein